MRTNYLALALIVANNFAPNSQLNEMTHHLMDAIRVPTGLPDTQEVVSILLSALFRV